MESSHRSEHGGQSEKWLKIRNGKCKKRNEAVADGGLGDSLIIIFFVQLKFVLNLLMTMSLFTCI